MSFHHSDEDDIVANDDFSFKKRERKSTLINEEGDSVLSKPRSQTVEGREDASRYLAMRARKTIKESLRTANNDEKFDFWYPSWDTWKFRRTLSYWIAVTFLEGSLLFVLGGVFSMTAIGERSRGNT
jgi:hypothetical protein